MEDRKETQITVLEMKTLMSEVEKMLAGVNSRLDTADNRMSELGGTRESLQNEPRVR